MQLQSTRSLRRQYLEWVEEQIEEYKDSVSRADLLRLADEVVGELRVSPDGQYQLTEILLCAAVDRKIFRLLRLPGYRSWCASRASLVPRPEPPRTGPAPEPARLPDEVPDEIPEPVAAPEPAAVP
jgi:hypothetical protein